MAINRFMKPWERDFSTERYLPDFAAWAQAVQGKEEKFSKTMEEIDALESKIPLAGLATQEKRQELVQDVRSKAATLAEELANTGRTLDVNRKIKSMAREVVNSPWNDVFAQDRAQIPNVVTATSDPMFNKALQGWYKDGQVAQVKELTDWKPDYYGHTPWANVLPEYQKHGDLLKPIVGKWAKESEGFIVEEDPETGEKYLYRKLENGVVQSITKEYLEQWMSEDGVFKDYIELAYNSGDGKGDDYNRKVYKQQKGEDMPLGEYARQVLAANLPRIFSHSDTSITYKKAGKAGTAKTGTDDTPKPTITARKVDYEMKLDAVPEDIHDLLTSTNKANKGIEASQKNFTDDVNKKIQETLGPSWNTPLFKQNSQGKFVRSDLNFQTLVETASGEQRPLSDVLANLRFGPGGIHTFDEYLAGTNAAISMHQSKKSSSEHILKELGFAQPKDISKLNKDIDKEYESYKIRAERLKKAQSQDISDPVAIANNNTILTRDQFAKTFLNSLEKENPTLKSARAKLKALKDSPYLVSKANSYSLTALDNKTKDVKQGLESSLKGLLSSEIQTGNIKLFQTDDVISGTQKQHLINVVNGYLGKGDDTNAKENYEYPMDIKIVSDAEDGWTAVYSIKSQSLAADFGAPYVELEVKLPEDMTFDHIGSDGVVKSNNVLQEFGIDMDGQRFEKTQRVSQKLQENNYTYDNRSKDNATFYNASLDIYQNPSKGVVQSTVSVAHKDTNLLFKINGGAREIGVMEDMLEGAKYLPKTPEVLDQVTQNLSQVLGIEEEQARTISETFVGDQIPVDNAVFLSETEGTYRIKGNVRPIVTTSMKQSFDQFVKIFGEDADIQVSNAHRTSEEAEKIKGADPDGPHNYGNALDLSWKQELENSIAKKLGVKSLEQDKMYEMPGIGVKIMIHGTGVNAKHIHIERI